MIIPQNSPSNVTGKNIYYYKIVPVKSALLQIELKAKSRTYLTFLKAQVNKE